MAATVGRPFHVDRLAPEHQQVQVQRPGTPSRTVPASERSLEPLERDEQGERRPTGSRPTGTSSATTAFRNSGWSRTPTGAVA